MEIAKVFGDVLRELRKHAKLNQEALAHASGVDRTYISLLERGLRQPSLKSIFSICSALGIQPSEMIAIVEKRCHSEKHSSTHSER